MITVVCKQIAKSKNDTVVIFLAKGEHIKKAFPRSIDTGAIAPEYFADFSADKNEKRLIYVHGNVHVKKVLIVGIGERNKVTKNILKTLIGNVYKYAQRQKIASISFFINGTIRALFSFNEVIHLITVTSTLVAYEFKKYKTKKEGSKNTLKELIILCERASQIRQCEKNIYEARIIARATNVARDLVNEPPNEMTPDTFAHTIARLAKQHAVTCTVLGPKEIIREKMGGLLAVGQGSAHTPRFVILHHKGYGKKRKKICLVGKGICFDSGGISLKPPMHMMDMKYDMAGGAACACAVLLAGKLKIAHEVIGLIPLAENAPDGNAYRPGDIITTKSGLNVEVMNTDAEGRMILSDALFYSRKYNPDVVIDVATLTGAAKVCLGNKAAALMGNNERLLGILRQCGDKIGERLWQLPLWEEYQDDLKSDIADLKNIGSKGAGTIIGGVFLSNFIPQAHWAHIDIASMAWEEEGKEYIAKGATGFGVQLLGQFLQTYR